MLREKFRHSTDIEEFGDLDSRDMSMFKHGMFSVFRIE